VITYAYDGLLRLTDAVESPGTAFKYAYDLAGNRTHAWQNGILVAHHDFDAANQVVGWAYDEAGNLKSDSQSLYTYDALNRMTTRGTTAYSYNGDGVLVADGTRRYTQDLASPLSQVLQITQSGITTNYLYGSQRLAAVSGSTRTWYQGDALGSVRLTLDDIGMPLDGVNYDPWGTVEGPGLASPFGFTGELHDSVTSLVYLRARWYNPQAGTFTSRDSFAGYNEQPYSQHLYQYSLSDPVNLTDPSGHDPWWVEPPRRPDNYFPTPYEAIEWKGRECAYAQIMHAPDVEQYCAPGPLTSPVTDASPIVGDVKGFVEVFTGCDLLTGEPLGAWRWLGLIGLSELRHTKHLGDFHWIVPDPKTISLVEKTWQLPVNKHGVHILGSLSDPEIAKHASDEFLRIKGSPHNIYQVLSHGSPKGLQLPDGTWGDAKAVAEWIRAQQDYKPGMPINLIACYAGYCPTGLAQQLADELGVRVGAWTGPIPSNQHQGIGDGVDWKMFCPGGPCPKP
jgi:RHS repeat-associated protein